MEGRQPGFAGVDTYAQLKVFNLLDVRSVCHFYAACSVNSTYNGTREHTREYLEKLPVEVSLDHIPKTDTTKIDFQTLALMPPWCKIIVKCSAGLWDLALWYLRQVEFSPLSLTIYNEANEDHFIYKDARRHFPTNKNIIALHLKRINVDANLIPVTVEELSLLKCKIYNPSGLLRLTNLTRFTNKGCRDFNNHSLPVPWVQLVTATIDYVPFNFRCDVLEEITITKPLIDVVNFRDFQCPHLQRVIFAGSIDVGVDRINDVFTPAQLSQLKVLKATHIVTPNFAQLPNAEVIHIQYNRQLTEDTVLPPNLTELAIKSSFAINGIPPQLKTFGFIASSHMGIVTIDSPTLIRLSLRVPRVTIDCPNLVELSLDNVHYVHLFVVPNLVKLKVEGSRASHISLSSVPHLRHLEMSSTKCDYIYLPDKNFDHFALENVKLRKARFTADTVILKRCELMDSSITAPSVQSHRSFVNSYGVVCQELKCDTMTYLPPMVEALTLHHLPSINGNIFAKCHNLESLNIQQAYFGSSYNEGLTVPATVRKLRFASLSFYKGTTIKFDDDRHLDYIECGVCRIKNNGPLSRVSPGLFIPSSFKQVGPYVWCRRDKLRLRRPPEIREI